MTTLLMKSGVRINGARPQLLRGIAIALEVWELLRIPELYLTSINDGQHMQGSLHYRGLAADLRTHNLRDAGVDADVVVAHLRAQLGGDWDVLHEFAGEDREHIHIEYDVGG